MEILSRPLSYFMECAETESMKEAAAHMSVTAAAISLSIKKLEEELGFRLFERSQNGLALTTKGAELQKHLQKHLRDLRGEFQSAMNNAERPLLTIGAIPQFVNSYLMRFLKENEKNLPRFRLYSGYSYITYENVRRGAFDFGFVSWTHKPEDLQSILIKKEPLAVAGLKKAFPDIVKAKNIKALEHYPIIWLPKIQKDPLDYFEPHKTSYVVHDYYAFKYLILHGHGIGEIQLDFFTKEEKKKLALAPFPAPREGVDVYLVYRENTSKGVLEVIQTLSEYFISIFINP